MHSKKPFFPNLDGLRFFAFFCVFLAHSFYSKFDYLQKDSLYKIFRDLGHLGIFGVNFFFVLSGFLITYLLLIEKGKIGKINIKFFYLRRILRIWPLYYLIVFIGFLIIPYVQNLIGNFGYEEVADISSFLFFYNNFSSIIPTTAVLGVLWSIAVEEQFYLFWPIVIRYISLKNLVLFCWFIIVISLLMRTFWIGYGYQNTLSCISDFAVGALLAYSFFTKANWINKLKNLGMKWIVLIYILGISMFLFRGYWAEVSWIYNNERLLFSIFFAFIILEQNSFRFSFYKCGTSEKLSALGRITYGLYMYHFIAIYIVSLVMDKLNFNTQLYQVLFVEPIIALFFSIFIAYLSYKYFEVPILRFKDRFSNIIETS